MHRAQNSRLAAMSKHAISCRPHALSLAAIARLVHMSARLVHMSVRHLGHVWDSLPQTCLSKKSEPVWGCAEPELEVVPPEDGRTRFLIDTMAAYVMEDGCDFEHVSCLFKVAGIQGWRLRLCP